MGRLNEFIARAANKEDGVKGRFWESRFKCQVLLDEAGIVAGMVYVDLNLIRAGVAETPEESDFTSIQERIRAWHTETMTTAPVAGEAAQVMSFASFGSNLQSLANAAGIDDAGTEGHARMRKASADASIADSWLCPIQTDAERRGILQMTVAEYLDLVDKSGRMIRSDKRGFIDADLAPILMRLGAKPDTWRETISDFGSRFRLAAGTLPSLRSFAHRLGRCWFKGVATARAAFATASPQSA